MLLMLNFVNNNFSAAVLFMQDLSSVIQGIRGFMTHRLVDSENMKISLARLVAGILLLGLVLFLSGRSARSSKPELRNVDTSIPDCVTRLPACSATCS